MNKHSIIIRLEPEPRTDFKIALLRQRVSMQKFLSFFIEDFVRFDKGDKNQYIEKLVKKSQ